MPSASRHCRRIPLRSLTTLLLATVSVGCAPAAMEGPELILTEGQIRLGDLRQPVAALAIEGHRVLASGSVAEIRALAHDDTQEMALEGAAVLPGLMDAWVDLEATGRWQAGLDVSAAVSAREVLALLRGARPDEGDWIVGRGWDETLWPDPTLPHRGALDELGDTPVLLYRKIGDVAWINTAALEAADLPDDEVEGLGRDAAGDPTGIVSGAALAALERHLPPASRAQRREWLESGARVAAAAGITTAITAPTDRTALELLGEIAAAGDLPLRVQVRLRNDQWPPEPSRDSSGDSMVTVRGLGVHADGPFRPPLAATHEAYGPAATRGPGPDREAIAASCARAREAGVPLDVMAHGDRAITTALEACPELAGGTGWLVGADLLPPSVPETVRVVALPLRMAHDLYWLDGYLGTERGASAHAFRDWLASGRLVGLASAAPEHAIDTTAWLRALSTRRDSDGYPLDGWHPGQRISVGDSLRVATRQPASPPDTPLADLVIWSADPFDPEVAPGSLRVMVTLVGGRVVYSRPLVDVPFDMQ